MSTNPAPCNTAGQVERSQPRRDAGILGVDGLPVGKHRTARDHPGAAPGAVRRTPPRVGRGLDGIGDQDGVDTGGVESGRGEVTGDAGGVLAPLRGQRTGLGNRLGGEVLPTSRAPVRGAISRPVRPVGHRGSWGRPSVGSHLRPRLFTISPAHGWGRA